MSRLFNKLQLFGIILPSFIGSAFAQQTVTITSIQDALLYNNTGPGYEYTRNVNYGSHIRISALAWTNSGAASYFRNMIRFDLSGIPTSAVIQSAIFYMYSDPSITSGADSNTGSNAFYLEKVTQSWNEFTVNWNNQPATTTTGRVWTGPSTSTTESRQINVTTLVQEWVNSPSSNFGVKMLLENEVRYRSRNYASSNHANGSIRPKLVVTYQVPLPPPVAPTALTAQANSTSSIILNWLDNATNESSYEIYRSLSEGAEYILIGTVSANTTSYTNTGLTPGTTYYYRVRAVNSSGTSAYTNTVSAKTLDIPAAPTEFTARATSETSVTLSWTDNSDNETAFEIERSLSSGGGYTIISSVSPNVTTFSDNNLDRGVSYYYRVRAVNGVGSSSAAEASAKTWLLENEQVVDLYGYQYRYDERGRMIKKKVPGADWVYMIYDDRDRVVFTQDGNQRSVNKWAFTKYDALNRPIMSGIYTHSGPVDQETMTSLLSKTIFFETRDNNTPHGYTDAVFSSANFDSQNFEVLMVAYYDDYSFKPLLNDTRFDYVSNEYTEQYKDVNGRSFETVMGQVTATKTKVLNEEWFMWTVSYFDDKYRPVQIVATNAKKGIDRNTSVFDFAGKLMKNKLVHNLALPGEQTVTRGFDYDHAGRLTKTWYSMNQQPSVLLSKNTYNEIGQLVTKKLHSEDQGTTFKQHVDYRFNIRGWLERINNSDLTPDDQNEPRDHFGINLAYNDVISGINNTPQYNGNISATKYSTNQGFDPGLKERAYKYDYDAMSRLTAASHYEKATGWNMSAGLHEDNIAYDLNMNMQSIRRKGADGSQMDNLAFTYTGNQLQTVTDSWDTQKGFEDGNTVGADYTYDANGNRITDKNKGITAYKYNYMNQREKVTFSDGNYLLYIYDAAGNKLSQGVYNSSNVLQKKTDYVGEFFYENDTLKYISHEEGRYNVLAGAYEYELRDHLGNNRVTFTTKEEHDEATATVETDNMMEEQSKFLRYENARRISSHLFDKTNGSAPSTTPGYAVRLNGTTNEKYGLARSFAVMPGDTVKAEVYVKYIDTNSSNWTTALNTLLSQIAGGTAPAGTVVDGGSYGSSTSSFPFPGLLNTSGSSGDGPKAYLNWLVFDQDFTLVNGGYVRMSDAAREYGQDCAHEYLSAEVPITTAGFVYVYFSNENETPVEVYYDQFAVDLLKSPVINATDLYPYGAPAISYAREFSLKQDKLLNGKETQDELGYNVVDLGQRDIDPFVPVFPTIDRFAEKYYSMSPYQYAAGNPVKYIDINGDSVWTTSESRTDADGNVTVTNTIHITGKVLRQSSGKATAQGVATGLNARLNSQKTTGNPVKNKDGTTTTTITKISANFTAASSMDDVSSSDHLVVIVDNVTGKADPKLGGGEAGGQAVLDGQIAYVENAGAVETAFHEVGHNLGMTHPDSNNGNPMAYNGRGNNFSPLQLMQAYNRARNGALNKGSNSAIMETQFPGVERGYFFSPTTTQSRPFMVAPDRRARIPLPLTNN